MYILWIMLAAWLVVASRCQAPPSEPVCVTGLMTEVQNWVDARGALKPRDESAIDLSSNVDPVPLLQQKIMTMRSNQHVKYLSMARCRLTEVPTVFLFSNSNGTQLSDTLEYLTLYGNSFADVTPLELYDVTINATEPWERTVTMPLISGRTIVTWSRGIKESHFPSLRELDLRRCSIQVLEANLFQGMPRLESLYISENEVYYIEGNAFAGLQNLIHLDFSFNAPCDNKRQEVPLTVENTSIFAPLERLSSLDLSHTKLTNRLIRILINLKPSMTRLSLCGTGLTNIPDDMFNKTSLRILDLSGNNGIFRNRSLRGIQRTLQFLYAKDTGLRTMAIFRNFEKLQVLDISMNEIAVITSDVTRTLKNLQILNLEKNRFQAWFSPTFSYLKSLKLLSLKDNNINVITDEMIDDMSQVHYLAMSKNFFVCNCHSRDFMDLALQNEGRDNHVMITDEAFKDFKAYPEAPAVTRHHRAFRDYNKKIAKRVKLSVNCTDCDSDFNKAVKGNFLLLDYHPGTYTCLLVPESRSVDLSSVDRCNRSTRDIDYDIVMRENRRRLLFLITIPGFLFILMIIFVFRRNLRYCLITVKNSTMLSLVHQGDFIDDDTIFHYDVFVSYCNEDRNWVLDQLLPHLESDCSVSACLHERDFQVGSSILENIVSCMDRSRSIMLIISRRFLLSQWCQFEMHLAQHRLLETRREELTLVLLEDVPRRIRPNTLHYLMLTKTYIVWPKGEAERTIFWRRLKKTLVMLKQKQSALEGASLA